MADEVSREDIRNCYSCRSSAARGVYQAARTSWFHDRRRRRRLMAKSLSSVSWSTKSTWLANLTCTGFTGRVLSGPRMGDPGASAERAATKSTRGRGVGFATMKSGAAEKKVSEEALQQLEQLKAQGLQGSTCRQSWCLPCRGTLGFGRISCVGVRVAFLPRMAPPLTWQSLACLNSGKVSTWPAPTTRSAPNRKTRPLSKRGSRGSAWLR